MPTPQEQLSLIASGVESGFWKLMQENMDRLYDKVVAQTMQAPTGDLALKFSAQMAAVDYQRKLPFMLMEDLRMQIADLQEKEKFSHGLQSVPPAPEE